MKTFIGTKLLYAAAMSLGAYNHLQGWTLPADQDPEAPGYLVEYTDGGKPNHKDYEGYISWSPKDVFEGTYRPVDGMTFGLALELVKKGGHIKRKGWNGEGQFVYLLKGSSVASGLGYGFGEYLGEPTFTDLLILRNTHNQLASWVPSIGDLLASDWQSVEVEGV
ncbi:hypothetical protein SKUL_8 [Pseudomonas phage Skulduggery]|uniref:Thoeris anti-defense 2-like domain-containing protein n=1 Tax=Pseudomonas phage Skulduggery TaxID=2006671 RepID=A0A1Y0T2L3_9CAUD|nr:hypothetical protein PP627_gp08 [Pseudomonas phage Skulduggery]ARV77107.1 hypothetical protein SKUL_8 [Pseudomonas phage Skulduggery]